MTVTQIARLFGLEKPRVSRLATDGTFVSNGEARNARRIDVLSVVRWELDRLNRQDAEYPDAGSR